MYKKQTPAKKRKYTKRVPKWMGAVNNTSEEPAHQPDNKEMLALIIEGVSRLSINDKAKVFTHILGKDTVDENQLWAIQKILA